ncbi:MAG: energy-coupling factor transporter transmembrane component T [Gemella sp.]|nr:energy-coupling factor transporter transmembrane component T [Gemella sp.]
MYLRLDIRAKMLLLLLMNFLMFKSLTTKEHFILSTIMFVLIVIFSSYKHALRIYAIYLFFALYEMFFGQVTTIKIFDTFMLVSALMFKTIYLPICAGIILVDGTKVSELITFLRRIKIPNSFIIVLAVIFRFFPVMLRDYKHISNSLKMKGIGSSKFYYIRHPLQFMEYVFVPYVIISSNIANELSISCLCRGIENSKNATSIQILKFKTIDYIFILFTIIMSYIVFML